MTNNQQQRKQSAKQPTASGKAQIYAITPKYQQDVHRFLTQVFTNVTITGPNGTSAEALLVVRGDRLLIIRME